MLEKKEYSRSVRMTKTVQRYVMSMPGDGFNAKFEAMVLHCMKEEKDLDLMIENKQFQLQKLCMQISEVQRLVNILGMVRQNLSSLAASVEEFTSELSLDFGTESAAAEDKVGCK